MKYIKQPKNYASSLLCKRRSIYSQHGEDGILAYLIDKLNIHQGWCCEFGAWDGKRFSNTFNLIENKNWKGVLIEADIIKFRQLQKTIKKLKYPKNVILRNKIVHYLPGKGTLLDNILSNTPIIKDFDILSIDVDGPDYHIWKSLTNYRPKIVIIEHSGIDDWIIQREGAIHKKDIDGSTSFWSMKDLGESKNYILLVDTGNLIFLDEKYFPLLN